ncbi:unnamed protein product [Soboliphyme baturini]|uniref:Uncharacterized protein n=1 Tax=Soboliphyme baturini TaxID=241478 RepID=A0A183IWE9_9BILA|nr:unnamed protein product [Soboliphyme baturini]
MFVGLFIGNIFFMTTVMVVLRSVCIEQRSLALSFATFLTNIIGFIPSPVIFGSIIDTACVAWYSLCQENGNCLLYDNAAFRIKYHVGNAAFQLLAIIAVIFTYCESKNLNFPDSETENEIEENEEMIENHID